MYSPLPPAPLQFIPKYWPGGIPEHIKVHPEPIPYGDDLAKELQGWRLFLEENYIPFKVWPSYGWGNAQVPPEEEAYEITHRRALSSQWASFSQETRGAYHSRAPLCKRTWCPPASTHPSSKMRGHYGLGCGGFIQCIAPLTTPRNRALWTKLRILLYLDNRDGMWFGSDNVSVVSPNPGTQNPEDAELTATNFLKFRSVEPALWDEFAMTRTGTVVFKWSGPVWIADQEALETGRLLLTGFESNGQLMEEANIRVRATNLGSAMIHLTNSEGVEKLLVEDVMIHSLSLNRPMPMELPVLDILTEVSELSILHIEGEFEEIAEHIEEIAPGYLEMEERNGGMVADYDHERFALCDEI